MSAEAVPKWCHPTWNYIHTWADYLPEHPDSKEVEQTIKGWLIGIPCKHPCRPEAMQYFANHPVELDNRTEIRKAFWQFHNYINRKLGKREMTWAEYENRYSTPYAGGVVEPRAAARAAPPPPLRNLGNPLVWSAAGFILTYAALHFLLSAKKEKK